MPLTKVSTTVARATGLEALGFLVQQANYEAIEDLISQHKAVISKQGYWSHGSTRHYIEDAMRDAILLGQTFTVKLLLDAGFPRTTFISADDGKLASFPLIYFAAKSVDPAMVQLLIHHGADFRESMELAHDKLARGYDGYKTYSSTLFYDYNAHARTAQVQHAFDAFLLENQSTFYSHFKLKDQLQEFFTDLNNSLIDIEKIQGSDSEKTKLIVTVVQEFKRRGIKQVDAQRIEAELDKLLVRLQDFDKTKHQLQQKHDELKNAHTSILRVLLDYVIGVNFRREIKGYAIHPNYGGLLFLSNLDVSGFNFIGVSVGGHPITQEMLIKQGVTGSERAIITISDLMALTDSPRQGLLLSRLDMAYHQRGRLISDEGIVNLVPLCQAAKVGDIAAVKSRLAAGIDPNETDGSSSPALILAATHGHADVVKILCDAQSQQSTQGIKYTVNAIQAARKHEHVAIANYLESKQDINTVNDKNETLLHLAVKTCDLKHIKELLAKSADVNLVDLKGKTALDIAIRSYELQRSGLELETVRHVIKLLLDHHAKVDVSTLAAALDTDSVSLFSLLLPHVNKTDVLIKKKEAGQSLSEQTMPWYVPLMFKAAEKRSSIEFLESLREEGADFNRPDVRGNTLFNHAIDILPSMLSVSKIMQEAHKFHTDYYDGPDPVKQEAAARRLEKAQQQRFETELELIHYLLECHAEAHQTKEHKAQSSHELIKEHHESHLANKGYQELFTKLKAKGGDIHAVCKQYPRLLHAAIDNGDPGSVSFLLEHGAHVHINADSDNHPLHRAIQSCFPKITKLLLEAGAEPSKQSQDGTSLLDLLEASYERVKNHLEERYLKAQTKLEPKPTPSIGLFGGSGQRQVKEAIDALEQWYLEELSYINCSYEAMQSVLSSYLETANKGLV